MSPLPRIVIIVASTRTKRFADYPLKWLLEQIKDESRLTFEVLDLREHTLPHEILQNSPAANPRKYESDDHREIGELFDKADGFLVLANEYNHGYSAPLKNTLDHFFVELNRKPISFLGYGNVGGARAIEQLRQVADELDMASVRPTVNILGKYVMDIRGGNENVTEVFAPLEERLTALLNDLDWWARALKAARDADREQTDASDEDS
ncbi:MAG TPA: NAD(P)H-dependent oxidoreductase [Galbitalea sp.]|jgi:NAD(P)H-dependent FMN reductase|nr:NAD(P)H-dependent oxidoreductase [Galbitalea sp.]